MLTINFSQSQKQQHLHALAICNDQKEAALSSQSKRSQLTTVSLLVPAEKPASMVVCLQPSISGNYGEEMKGLLVSDLIRGGFKLQKMSHVYQSETAVCGQSYKFLQESLLLVHYNCTISTVMLIPLLSLGPFWTIQYKTSIQFTASPQTNHITIDKQLYILELYIT